MSKALQLYKQLHRTSRKVFKGDPVALGAMSVKIREEYNKNRHVDNEKAISELIKFGQDVDEVLRKRVLQLEETEEKKYKANIREDMEFGENTEFRDDISQAQYEATYRKGKKSCVDIANAKEKKAEKK